MAITGTNALNNPVPFAIGDGLKLQLMTYRALSGSTSGTITADGLTTMKMIMLDGQIKNSALPTYSGNVATLAFVVPAETAAVLIVQDLTYTAVADLGQDGNSITIRYVAGGTAGSEVVTVSGTAISVSIEDGVSTATQVRAKINASAAATALIVCTLTGTGSNAQSAASATPLAGGVTGGARGSVICLGV